MILSKTEPSGRKASCRQAQILEYCSLHFGLIKQSQLYSILPLFSNAIPKRVCPMHEVTANAGYDEGQCSLIYIFRDYFHHSNPISYVAEEQPYLVQLYMLQRNVYTSLEKKRYKLY